MGVDKLVDSTELDNNLTRIANAIRTTGSTSASLKYPEGFINAIEAIPTSIGGPVAKKQVNFIDYDGTLLYSYTAQEANALDALPANPSHTGLTAQGWNWTLAQIKAQLTAMPNSDVWIGQMYITESGNTEIDVSMPKGRLSPNLIIAVDGTVTVNWGDNTSLDTVTGNSLIEWLEIPHTYASPGNYTIAINVTSGSFTFYGDSSNYLLKKNTTANENKVYANCVQNIRIGSGITNIGYNAFYYCTSLASITIPNSIISISGNAFFYCYSLASITIPSEVTLISSSTFYTCYSLASVSIPSGMTVISSSAFQYCYALSSITIPNGVTSIGNNALYYCYSLFSVTIPSNVTSISNNLFGYCYSLASITIPSSVTSIGNNIFYSCNSLASITIPSEVTSIGSQAFYRCYGVSEYHLLSETPPTLSNEDAFETIVSDSIIYVPYSADHSILEAYQTADNWSTYASYMQEEPQ